MMRDRVILASGLATTMVGYNLWPRMWHGFFYQAMAMSFLLLFVVIVRLSRKDEITYKIAVIGLFLAFNNLIDEMFFDPGKFGVNEYVVAAIIILYTFFNRRGKWRLKRK